MTAYSDFRSSASIHWTRIIGRSMPKGVRLKWLKRGSCRQNRQRRSRPRRIGFSEKASDAHGSDRGTDQDGASASRMRRLALRGSDEDEGARLAEARSRKERRKVVPARAMKIPLNDYRAINKINQIAFRTHEEPPSETLPAQNTTSAKPQPKERKRKSSRTPK